MGLRLVKAGGLLLRSVVANHKRAQRLPNNRLSDSGAKGEEPRNLGLVLAGTGQRDAASGNCTAGLVLALQVQHQLALDQFHSLRTAVRCHGCNGEVRL